METEQDLKVRHDLRHLMQALTKDHLDPAIMFAPSRGIRSCTPPFDKKAPEADFVAGRLKRVELPKE